jgi:pyruvate/2-oxoglutarate dehydrogenase complex dihydrolipoamide acyltransferase (E2) component
MSEGTVVEWAVAEGARVTRDQALLAIETEKVVTDLPAPCAGFVHMIAKPGQTMAIETIIGKIADTEEEYRALVNGAGSDNVNSAGNASGVPAPQAAPAAAQPANAGAGDARGNAQQGAQRIRASGLAKAIARKNGLDLAQIRGSGPGGRIVRRDVVAVTAAASAPSRAVSAEAPGASAALRERARVPLSGMRAAIAQKMLAAKTTAAQTYTFFEVDITKLAAARKTILGYEESLNTRVSLMAFYARALAIACQHVPICNATLQNGEITVWENVNVGIAVALPGRTEYESGLIVPVVRNVQSKGLLQIDREIKELIKKARASELTPMDTAEGTITISSTQGFFPGGWMVSTPLLNLPQVVNFQPGSPIEKPVVVDGQIAIREMLPCGLTLDHRATDGEPIGRFIKKLGELLANPELMLL